MKIENQKKDKVRIANRFTKIYWATLGMIMGSFATLIFLNFTPKDNRDSFTGVWDKTVYAVKIAFTSSEEKEKTESEVKEEASVEESVSEDSYDGPSGGLLPTMGEGEDDPFVGMSQVESSKQLLKELIKTGEIKKRLTPKQVANIMCAEYDGEKLQGDLHLGADRSYGVLQIRQPCVLDVNKTYGTRISSTDCEHDVELSVLVMHAYINRYVDSGILPKNPTFRDMALFHTSGPTGYKNNAKLWYWDRVKGKTEKEIAVMYSQFGKYISQA